MLSRITVENFFSIADAQEVSFRVPANAPDLYCFRASQAHSDVRLPVVAGIYGPNASGKSTILRSIIAVAGFAQNSFSLPPNSQILVFNPYLHKSWWNRPTKITVEYDGTLDENSPPAVFRYELHITNHPTRFANAVAYEALSYAPQGKFRKLFERHGQDFSFGPDFDIKNTDQRIQTIRPNASVISTLAQYNHAFSVRLISSLNRGIHTNFIGLNPNDVLAFYAQHPEYLHRLNRELGRLDLGLEEMTIIAGSTGPIAVFKHSGLDTEIALANESNGTRKFIEIFPRLQLVLDCGGLAVIDELDTDIHPLLMPEILDWFYDEERNPHGAQLLFTAHNPAILDELEKEQVFFTEKPMGQATRIYGARDIKGLRREPSLAKKYLSGELGAIPHIG